jgi:hypothetical protein
MSLIFDPNRLEIPTGHMIGGCFLELGEEEIPVLRPSAYGPHPRRRCRGPGSESARKALTDSRWSRMSQRRRQCG